jgi:uncharacterized protein
LEYRRLGRTGLKVSCLGFGGMGLISQNHSSRAEAVKLFEFALDCGINFVDTARGYFDSESIIGEAIKHRRQDCILASKTYLRTFKTAYRQLEESLENFQVQHIDLYQIHHLQYPEELQQVMTPDGAYSALTKAREEGLIKWIGVSSHNPKVLFEAVKTGKFDTVQFPFNPVESEFWDKIKDLATKLDLGTIVMKPFCGGNIKSTAAVLRYLLSFPVSTVIPGCTTIEQVQDNVKAAEGYLPLDLKEQEALKEEIKNLPDQFCRRCRYCITVCPNKVPIPEIFRCEDYLILNATYARNSYRELPLQADSCLECGKCEMICPYKLSIRAALKRAHSRLTRGKLEDLVVNFSRKFGIYDKMRKFYFDTIKKIPQR